jgi:hypothetical protein
MKSRSRLRIAGIVLALLLSGSPEITLAMAGGQASSVQHAQTSQAVPSSSESAATAAPSQPAVPAAPQRLPDSPGAVRSQVEQAPVVLAAQETDQPQAPSGTIPRQPQQPTGTAAAESPVTNGTPASEPAGAAIAPAPQHQVRSWIIKMGAVIGAGVAIGTVAALSSGSPSRPPGSH